MFDISYLTRVSAANEPVRYRVAHKRRNFISPSKHVSFCLLDLTLSFKLWVSFVSQLLLQIADDFIESVVTASCQIAKHRKSNTLEVRDVQLHLGWYRFSFYSQKIVKFIRGKYWKTFVCIGSLALLVYAWLKKLGMSISTFSAEGSICMWKKIVRLTIATQINELIGWMMRNSRSACFFVHFFDPEIFWSGIFISEFKNWRRQQQRHISMIWLVGWWNIIVLHVRHAFWCYFLT